VAAGQALKQICTSSHTSVCVCVRERECVCVCAAIVFVLTPIWMHVVCVFSINAYAYGMGKCNRYGCTTMGRAR
jgi:hypothetical protein